MPPADLAAGTLVRHPAKPDWGLGKIVELTSSHVWVYFKDIEGSPKDAVKHLGREVANLEIAEVQSDPVLDNLPPMVSKGRVVAPDAFRLTERQAIDMFVKRFGSFEDRRYLGHERDYKWAAHLEIKPLVRAWEHGTADSPESLTRAIHLTNLLARQESIALNDAFKVPKPAIAYSRAVAAFSHDPTEPNFVALVDATASLPERPGGARVLSWPTVTLLPYLAAPKKNMFLKPTLTKAVAEICFFDLLYNARPNWTTYKRLMGLSEHLLNRLRPLGARDFIDVQSFMWPVAGSRTAGIRKA